MVSTDETRHMVVPYHPYEERWPPTRTWAFMARDADGRTYTVGGFPTRAQARQAAEHQRALDEERR